MRTLAALFFALALIGYCSAYGETVNTQRTVVIADLDGNGVEEEVVFDLERITEPISPDRFHITIDGVRSSFGGSNLTGDFRVVDIDSTDNLLELAVPEYGPSDDCKSYFFRYLDGALIEMGALPGRLMQQPLPLLVDGGGTVFARCRGHVLHTWFYACKYRVTANHIFELIREPFYSMGAELKILAELDLHSTPGSDEIVATLQPGDKLTILGSDDINWCQVETEPGLLGWFEVDDRGYTLGGRMAQDVFDGLWLAD